MDTKIILVYCLCDDMFKAMHHHEDDQCQMSNAEVMTVAIVAAMYYFDLPAHSQIIGDKAYNHYILEDVLEEADLQLLPIRKHNSKRPFPPWMRYLQAYFRIRIETSGSLLERLLPKSIHAVTAQGFELKFVLFVLALSFSRLPISG